MGVVISAKDSLGNQPLAEKMAVRKPHAMKAPMLGITMPLRNLPNLERPSRSDIGPSFPGPRTGRGR